MIKRYTENQIEDLVNILKKDGVIAVPTDTVYGVCASTASKEAEDHLREVKNRPFTKAFPLMCKDIEEVKKYAIVDERSETIMHAFMPGPLTVILPKRDGVLDYMQGDLPSLAIRLATSDVLKEMINQLGNPIFMTSANQSGQAECKSLDEIEKACPLLDGMLVGEPAYQEASTIVSLLDEIKILREGPISLKEIEAILDESLLR